MKWIGTWATAPQPVDPGELPPAPGLAHRTLRQIVGVSIGASRLRVHFSNAYGTSHLELRAAQLALATGRGTVDPVTARPLRFAGQASATIPAGATLSSDPLDFELSPSANVALSLAFGSTPSEVTGHSGSRTTSYVAAGECVAAASLPSPITIERWYFVTGIDVLADPASGAVVVLGDSITDGRGSTTDGNDRWPDQLSRRLRRNSTTSGVAVLNLGIGGNAVLAGGLGPTAVSRFQRDVLDQSGVRWVIVLHGVNDIGSAGPSDGAVAERLIRAYRDFVTAARARSVRVFGVPILPFGGSQYESPEHEASRQAVNAWIRGSGTFDAVIDLDAAVRDPATPATLLAAYDSGDHLHLSVAGYERMAQAIELALFTP